SQQAIIQSFLRAFSIWTKHRKSCTELRVLFWFTTKGTRKKLSMFGWMDYVAPGVVAHAVLALSIVVALGLLLGALGFRGIRLGTAGVLFVGLMLGQAGLSINHDILEFVRDFGLILFVYTVG